MKKIIFGVVSLVILALGLAYWMLASRPDLNKPCAFCDPVVLQTHTFYEDETVRCLCTHKPLEPGHCLIIPKRHIERFEETSEEEITAIGRSIKKINRAIQKLNGPCSYLILQKNGTEVGQTVPHVHVHYIPRKVTHNKFPGYGLLWDFVIEPFKKPLKKEQMAECVQTMKHAIAST